MIGSRKFASTKKSEQQIAKMSEIHHFGGSELDRLNILHTASVNKSSVKIFRDLRNQLLQQSQGKNYVCLVTSVLPQGGATHVCRNLCAAVALDRTKTAIYVDCNFYAPAADSLLSAEANVGLADYLNAATMGVEYIVYASGVSRVRVVPAGNNPRAAAEQLSSARMNQFISEAKARYPDRFTFIDAPSVNEYPADVRVLADLCDFVVLVVPYGKATAAHVEAACDTLKHSKVASLLLNHC